jgi:hypothetical protein
VWRAIEVTVSQRTVLRTRLPTSILHAFIVWGFLYYFLINAGDVLEGFFRIEFLGHGFVGDIYRLVGDVLSVLVLISMSYFLVRRFIVKTPVLAFHENVKLHPNVLSGIRRDSLIVGVFILVHVGSRFLSQSFCGTAWRTPGSRLRRWSPGCGRVRRGVQTPASM